jgi:hypothetical protein
MYPEASSFRLPSSLLNHASAYFDQSEMEGLDDAVNMDQVTFGKSLFELSRNGMRVKWANANANGTYG